ncbi:MAG: putative membrane protein [Candidatus Woesearchaeota archaeon]|jgi:putative membrane protein
MGLVEIIPGISGGTVALLTGIYEKLISAISDLNLTWIKHGLHYLLSKKASDKKLALTAWKKLHLSFFIPLIIGMILAIYFGAIGIGYALTNFPAITLGVFIGLVFASAAYLLYGHRNNHSLYFHLILGFLLGIIMGSQAQSIIESTNVFVTFFAGFLAFTVMIIPGVSGSYVLLLLGQYERVRNAVVVFDVDTILVFGVGGLCGLLITARIMKWLLKKYHDAVIVLVGGLIVGSLISPIRDLLATGNGTTGIITIFVTILISFLFLQKVK